MKRCPTCGATALPGYRFCAGCGTPLDAAPDAPAVEAGGLDAGQAAIIHLLPAGDRRHPFHDDILIGRTTGQVQVPDDGFLSSRHATVVREGPRYVLRDLGSRNGTYVRIREPVELAGGDHVMMGSQVFRVDYDGPPAPHHGALSDPGATRLFGAEPVRAAGPQLVRILEGGVEGERILVPGREVVVGRTKGDLVYPEDGLLSGTHASFEPASDGDRERLRVRDRGSRNGVLLRLRSDWPLRFGDVFSAGRQVFRFEAGSGA